jgi:hypothetical protein
MCENLQNILEDIERDIPGDKKKIRELSYNFFAIFSYAEYLLKNKGFLKNNKAEADWDEFIKSVKPSNIEEKSLILGKYILENPPKKQRIDKDGKLYFRTYKVKDYKLQQLNIHIRRVRNNLFHGGKYAEDGLSDRDQDLLESATNVLCCWIGILKKN